VKRFIVIILLLAILLAGCGGNSGGANETGVTTLKFSDSVEIIKIDALRGKHVSIVGYMATLSPLSGKYLYLMNLPYQSCPFCIPNTTQLANTIAVFAKSGQKFDYTDQAVRVSGRMETGEFSDDFGYVYNYRIADASIEIVDLTTVSNEYKLWQSIASDGIIPEIYAMFDYVYFICQWPYYQQTAVYEDGTTEDFYLFPGDVEMILADDGPYGYAPQRNDRYFPNLIARVQAISDSGLNDLVEIINEARALEQYAYGALTSGDYTLDEATDQFTLTRDMEIAGRFDAIYEKFSLWIAQWEL